MESFCSVPYSSYMYVSSGEIHEAVSSLKMGKSPGIDCVNAEHIKYAGEVLIEPLRILMSSMLIHGYMPENMIKGVIVEIIKSKTKGVNDKKNNHPVCLSTMISRIFEHILLNRLKPHLETCHNQFGFKPKMGTELCILILKEKGLQNIINKCVTYSNLHKIVFNETKTVCMHVESVCKTYKWKGIQPKIMLGTNRLSFVFISWS